MHPVVNHTNHWAVVLAGGDGQRLKEFTRRIFGDDRPKQFCPLLPGGRTLLQQTRARTAKVVKPSRTVFVCNRRHQRFYGAEFTGLPADRILVQPENRGTLAAVLYGLIAVARREPNAVVGIFPSDHYYAREDRFLAGVRVAFRVAASNSRRVILLGAPARYPEPGYGYIETLDPDATGLSSIRRFWEKPSPEMAQLLVQQGCLWNTFVMVGRVQGFLNLIRQAAPEVYEAFEPLLFRHPAEAAGDPEADVEAIYSSVPPLDFASCVLTKSPGSLAVVSLGASGWSDLGEPQRLVALFSPEELRMQELAYRPRVHAHAC